MSIDLRNHFFNIFDLTSSFMTQGQKEVGIYLSPLNHDKWLSLHTNLNFLLLLFLVKKIKSLSSKQSKLNIWNRLHAKIAFLCRLWTQIGMWRPNYTICTSNVIAILKAGQNFSMGWRMRGLGTDHVISVPMRDLTKNCIQCTLNPQKSNSLPIGAEKKVYKCL